ncbi:MAG: preprotein translocase subunit SecE, partial [Firmicutes bacterium]|nr:preprotein translocase subunit SecE [Bacillota bacterium]
MAVIKAKKGKKGRARIDKPLPPQKGKKAKQAEDSQNDQVPKSGNVEPLRRGTLRRNVSKKTFRTGEFVKNVRQFFSGAWQEMKKVHWPGRRVVVAYTG